jgi:hypothetical protein
MTTKQEALDAANKKPANRSAHEQGIVDNNLDDQAVRNTDHEARRQQRIYGK